ncbi:MAG: methyltransferase, partial [Verrucomicrobiota bacterium]
GCGLGHDSRALAEHTDAETILGLEISPEALRLAAQFPRAGVESYLLGNLFDLASEHLGVYDWVWEHTCFCAIEPELRDDYVSAVWSALKPGGQLLAVFYLDPYDEEHPRGGGPPHGTSIEELKGRFEDSGFFQIGESYVPARSYEGREGLERVMRMTKQER